MERLIEVEKTLIKWAFYGFLFGMAASILLVNYKEIDYFSGGYTTEYKPVFDYIISILRFSIIGLFLGLFVGWKISERKSDKQVKTYYFEFSFVTFCIAIILSLIFGW